jgi:hypothetical protein
VHGILGQVFGSKRPSGGGLLAHEHGARGWRRAGLSGIGREGGTWSFDFYSDVKNTVYAGQGWSSHG